MVESPPLMLARSAVRVRVLWDTVLEQAWALPTRHALTGNRDIGYNVMYVSMMLVYIIMLPVLSLAVAGSGAHPFRP